MEPSSVDCRRLRLFARAEAVAHAMHTAATGSVPEHRGPRCGSGRALLRRQFGAQVPAENLASYGKRFRRRAQVPRRGFCVAHAPEPTDASSSSTSPIASALSTQSINSLILKVNLRFQSIPLQTHGGLLTCSQLSASIPSGRLDESSIPSDPVGIKLSQPLQNLPELGREICILTAPSVRYAIASMRSNVPSLAPQFLRSRLTKVCVAIIGSTPAEMIEKAYLRRQGDAFSRVSPRLPRQAAARTAQVQAVLRRQHGCDRDCDLSTRRAWRQVRGSLAAEVEILSKAAEAGFQLADSRTRIRRVAQESRGAEAPRHRHRSDRQPPRLCTATKDLDGIFARIDAFAPDFVKIVPTAKALVDNVTLIRFLERMNDHTNIIGICMGDAGIISRVLGVRAGSAFTFAAATPGRGDWPWPDRRPHPARNLPHRPEVRRPPTKVYGVAGNPIRSSLSPVMMNTAFRRETVNAVYLALQTSPRSRTCSS